ncbi:MAG: hypothetical protein IJW52_06565 [Clostridia bacterium]|nr:hypothetical protein [Clostridia bacterium]
MKKRVFCLLLSALMIAFCFVSCAEKNREEVMIEIGEKASEGAVTLSMYLISEKPVSAEQEKLMEEAVNAITEKEFKVRMDLRYFTPEEYYARLEADLAEQKRFYANEGVGKKDEEPVYIDENGLPQTWFPSIEEFGVDIFYFSGYDRYLNYADSGYLRDLSTQIDGTAKSLKAVINAKLLQQVKALNGKYDMVPVNRAIGEYTYILLNKDVLKGTQYSATDINSLVDEDCQDLLGLVGEVFDDEYVPLKSFTGELDLIDTEFFGADANGYITDDFSVLAGTYNSAWNYGAAGSYPEMSNILATKNNGRLSVAEQIKVLKGYEFAGYYGTEADADKPFAVGYIKGGPEIAEVYGDDYEIIPVALPTIETEDVFEHCFAVSEKTNSELKSAQILNHLNTNEEFRNLILYGIEGKNYVWTDAVGADGNLIIDENGEPYKVVTRLDDKEELIYDMDVYKTGNVILAYPADSENPLAREYALQQNHDLQIEYTIGFDLYIAKLVKAEKDFDPATAPVDKNNPDAEPKKPDHVDIDSIKAVSVASKNFEEKINAAATADELDAVFAEIEAYLDSDELKAALDMPGNEEEEPEVEAPETPEGETPDGEGAGEEAPEEEPEEEKVYTSIAFFYDKWLASKSLKVVAPAA